MANPLLVERRGAVVQVTIDRAGKRNALNVDTLAALRDRFRALAADESLIAVVLRGAGERAFAAGGDLRELQALDTVEAISPVNRVACDALAAIRELPVPVIAAVNGDALGGGCELALACDLRIAAPHARMAFLQGTLAVPPGWGGGEDLMQAVGTARALELLGSSRTLTAGESLALGLVQEVAPEGEAFEAFVEAWVSRWSHQRPQVMRALKAATLRFRRALPMAERDAHNFEAFVQCWVHADHLSAAERKIASLGR